MNLTGSSLVQEKQALPAPDNTPLYSVSLNVFIAIAVATWLSLLSSNIEMDSLAIWLAPAAITAAFLKYGVARSLPAAIAGVLVGMYPFDAPGVESGIFFDPVSSPVKLVLFQTAFGGAIILHEFVRRFTRYPQSADTFQEISHYIVFVHGSASLLISALAVGCLAFVPGFENLHGSPVSLFMSWFGASLGGGLLVLSGFRVLFALLGGEKQSSSSLYLLLGASISVVLVIGFVQETWKLDRQALQERVRGDLMAIAGSLGNDIKRARLSLDHIAGQVALNGDISRAEFDYFAEREMLLNPVLVSINYAPVIEAAAKPDMEARIRREFDDPDGGLYVMDRERNRLPVVEKHFFVPVLYQYPWRAETSFVGFDFDHRKIRKDVLATIARTRTFTISGSIGVRSKGDKGVSGILLVSPVIMQDRINGYIISAFQSDNFMNNALSQFKGQYLLNIRDRSAVDRPLIFWAGEEEFGVPPMASRVDQMGGREWEIGIYPTPAYLAASNQATAFVTSTVATILAILYCFLAHTLAGNRRAAEKLVQQRTAELERANRAKTDFLANVSHEIRTPMNGILGMLTLLEESGDPAEQREYMALARMSGQGLLHVINDILDLSKLEKGHLEIVRKPGDLEQVIKSTVAMLEPAAAQKGLGMFVHAESDVPLLEFDSNRVGQILINLISNAIKFTEEGRISVFCDVLPADEKGKRHVRISIEDTGIGIPAADQPEIFNRFRQADNSNSRKHQGTGLGLAITQELLGLMGGTIRLESAEGKGTSFVLELEMKEADDRRVRDRETWRLPSRDNLQCTVLIAEDNRVNQMLIRKMLEKQGLHVQVASNGREAVEYVEGIAAGVKTPVDLILMDVQMPEMDGVEAMHAIRDRDDILAAIPIIAVTANAMPEQAEEYRKSGMDGFVSKPVDFVKLSEEIKKVLSN